MPMTRDELGEEIEQCNPRIQATADRWVREFPELDREDVVQEIVLAFAESNKTYKMQSEAAFSTFAFVHAHWRLLAYARQELAHGVHLTRAFKKLTRIDMADLHGVVADGIQLHETIAAPGHEHEPVIGEELWDKLKLVLTNRQYEVMELTYLDDLDAGEIAERLGVSVDHVTGLALEARDRIRDFMPHLGALIQWRAAS